ncbi:hypothetical protein Vretifemale_11675 [Volvox reticuliferus]|uniref:Uncharacterized protein n=1 Tax=Volvox reticuliferus TaxID=1737510 RepID=A0A8J4CJM9_9CHLO|nr:hypothetical protein Vretifemale_11675 [Volvox reticuliferus]
MAGALPSFACPPLPRLVRIGLPKAGLSVTGRPKPDVATASTAPSGRWRLECMSIGEGECRVAGSKTAGQASPASANDAATQVCLIRSEDWPQGLPTCREAQNSTSGSSFSPSVLSLVVPKMTTSGSGRSGAGGEPGEAASNPTRPPALP